MTWSIIARDPVTGSFGIAVASKFFAAGALVPWIRSGFGAVATQAMVNPLLGPNALGMLEIGEDAATAVEFVMAADQGRNVRQLHVVDRDGGSAGWTGGDCISWCGHRCEPDVSVAGNMLAGPQVLEATLSRWHDNISLPFAERLLEALLAGDEVGGDKRGRQSAALVTYTTEIYPEVSIRVDDHPDPLNELRRVYRASTGDFAIYRRYLPTRQYPAGSTDRERLLADYAACEERHGTGYDRNGKPLV